MGTHPRFKAWHGILVAVFILGLVAGAHFWGSASAQDGTGAATDSSTVVAPPQDTSTREVIAVEGGAVDVSGGVTVGTNRPAASPGTPSQPVPQFSAVNTPVWVNSQGPAQIVDDLIVYGLTEVKGGLINNGGAGGGGGGAPAPTPELTIAPAPGQPVGSNILQSDVWDFLVASMQLSATGADVTVNTIKIAFDGTASPANFNTLKLYDGASLLGNPMATFDANNKTTVTGFTLTIPAGTQKTLTLRAFMDGTAAAANSTFRFGIIDPLDVTNSDSSPTGTAMGNLFTVAAPPAPTLTVASAGSNPPAQTVLKGTTGITTTAFTLTAGTAANITVTSIAVTRGGGSTDADLGNVKLVDGATQYGPVNVASGTATFSGLNLVIIAGSTKTLTVITDIPASAAAGNTFTMSIASANNITATSTSAPTVSGTASGNTFTITGAPLTVAIAGSTPASATVTQGSANLATTAFNLTTGTAAAVTVTSIAVTRTGSSTDTTDLANIKLYDGASQLATVTTLSGGKATFSGLNLAISAGTTKTFTVKTDVQASATPTNKFALSITAASDISGTTTSNGAPTISGTATGSLFTITAPPTLTLARNPVPAAGTLTSGAVTLLEFDASMNTGSVQINGLYVKPIATGDATTNVANYKLKDAGNITLATGTAATVGGRSLINFAIATPPSIGTSVSRFKVTADIVCGSGTIDVIVDQIGDVIINTPPAGLVKQGAPFTQVSRSLPLCAPAVSYKCSNSKLYADIGWSTFGKGDDTAPTAGFYIDLDNETAFTIANAFRTGAGYNGFWNATSNYTTNSTFSLAENAKIAPYSLGGYNPGGAAPSSLTNLAFGATYQARIYYPKTGEHSLINAFTAPASCTGYPTFGSVSGFSLPGDTSMLRISVLNFDGESFPYRSTSEQNEPVALFGSFIPQANAGFIEKANAQAAPPAPVNPVYIFDDLYVYGNGAGEPGNIYLQGEIFGAPETNAINMSSNLQLTSNLNVLGATSMASLNVANGATISNGLTIQSGNLSVTSGNITAASIGAYYRLDASSTTSTAGSKTKSVTCGTGDILVFCNGQFDDTEVFSGTAMSGLNCTAKGRQITASSKTLQAQAVCFNPDRSAPASFTGTKVDL